jgi:peroxiredoxin Q/BCP
MSLKVGDAAPDFEAIDTRGSPIRLVDYRGRKLVLYFYPMDDTPGCTKQACSLRDFNAEIARKGAAILGVSAQSKDSHQRFTEKYRLNFPLLVDTGQTVAKAYPKFVSFSGFWGMAIR